jgi:hypothetical protein
MVPCNVDDATFLSIMSMGQSYSHDQWYQETPSQQYDQQDYDLNLESNGEGFIEPPKGRTGNYTIDEDILLCTTHGIRHGCDRGHQPKVTHLLG